MGIAPVKFETRPEEIEEGTLSPYRVFKITNDTFRVDIITENSGDNRVFLATHDSVLAQFAMLLSSRIREFDDAIWYPTEDENREIDKIGSKHSEWSLEKSQEEKRIVCVRAVVYDIFMFFRDISGAIRPKECLNIICAAEILKKAKEFLIQNEGKHGESAPEFCSGIKDIIEIHDKQTVEFGAGIISLAAPTSEEYSESPPDVQYPTGEEEKKTD